MKIFFCDNRLGGLLGFRADVIRHLIDNGHDVTLLTPKAQTDWDKVGQEIPGAKFVATPMSPNSFNPFKDIRLILWLFRFYYKERPDIVFNYTIKPNVYSSIIAHMLGFRSIVIVTGLGYMFQGDSFIRRLGRWCYKQGLRCAQKTLILNEDNLRVLRGYNYVKDEQVVLMKGGEGVNLQLYPYIPKSYQQPTHFLVVSRVLYDKGYKELVEAAQILKQNHPDIRVEWLGPMAEESPMRVRRSQMEEDVRKGYIEYVGISNNVIKYLSEDGVVIVLPSYHEGMSRSLMEALATGCPIITSDIAGCKEMVENGVNGFLIPPRDAKQLAEAMLQLFSLSSEQKQAMGRESRRIAEERFDMNNVIKLYDQLIEG